MAQINRVLWLCAICGILNVCCEEYKVINTNDGLVRGRRNVTVLKNIPYYSFKGIPYAKPPTGDLRFKAPEPVDPWKPNVFDASKHGNICVQPGNFLPLTSPQSEDCLTLNIYVPADIQSDEKLAVLFFIHGGGYVEGSGDQFFSGNDFITERHVILVTINYRLGLFGFLSLGLVEYSGNMGLKDQQLALKWINENIERFGGDSKRITIFGHSAGSAATHFHILSAESRKFFRNALCMSGTVDNFWAMATNNDNLNFAYRIAEELGESKSTIADLLEFLHSIDANKLNPYNIVNITYGRVEVVAAPVIERMDAIRPFLVLRPETIYETSNIGVNTMFSHTSLELLGTIFHSGYPLLKDLNTRFDLFLPFRNWTLPRDSERYRNLNNQIRQFYFGNDSIDEQHILQYVSLFSDLNFVYGIDKTTQFHASKSTGKTFYYRFSVDSTLNIAKRNNSIYLPGASHADDQCYLFRCGSEQSIYDDIINMKDDQHAQISLRTIDSLTKIVTNFAKYDNPTHENDPVSGFQPIENGIIHFLDVNNEGLIPGLDPNKKVRRLWTRIENLNKEFNGAATKEFL